MQKPRKGLESGGRTADFRRICVSPLILQSEMHLRHVLENAPRNPSERAAKTAFIDVGYQQYPLVAGYNLYSPVFEVINGSMNLQDLKLVGDSVTGGGANNICLLDADGVSIGYYEWWTPDDGTGEEEGCWFDGDNWETISATIKAGEGLYLYAVDSDLTLTIPSAL